MAKRGRSEQHALDEEQVEALLGETTELEDRVALELMCYLGLRVSEICHLRRNWVRDGEIRIPRSQPCNCSNCQGEWRAKSMASVRSIPIPDLIAKDLYMFLEHTDGFPPLTRQALWWKVKQIAKKAKIKECFPHSLRATAATRMSAFLTAPELCYTLGWRNLEMGQHYINIFQAKAGASKKIKEMLK